jgi:hypothetical protein
MLPPHWVEISRILTEILQEHENHSTDGNEVEIRFEQARNPEGLTLLLLNKPSAYTNPEEVTLS